MFEEVNVYHDNEGFLMDNNGNPYLPNYTFLEGGTKVFLAPYPELNGNGGRKVLPIAVITPGGVVLKKP